LIASVAWPIKWIVLVGCLFASFGAALQCITSAPRLLQAISKDQIIPLLKFVSNLSNGCMRGLIPSGEPRRALLLTLVVAECFVLIGSLDAIANVVTMYILYSINFMTGKLGYFL
jgi:potassium/chloride transporter 4/5/6